MVGEEPTTLVIDSATEACSVALFAGERLIAGDWQMLGRGHAEKLVPMIAALPNSGKADRIAVALGPGSFTGVRVGLAAARGLALAWRVPLIGYPTLALIAATARAHQGMQTVAVINTGGHGEWFVETFGPDGASIRPLASLRPEAAVAAIDADLVAGSQAQALVEGRHFGTAIPLWPDARNFPMLAETYLRDEAQPLYGRGPDAKLPAKTQA